ncbi:MAG: insulinase family protein [Candidatus Marinimicrobia bacterium]|nr:insulinase family protein [Candidatus Neomarinimicrobiota bacterium]
MKRSQISVIILSLGLALQLAAGQVPDIPYTKFVLDNGLTLIVHEDHKAPIVAVNIWYHVGSKNEKPGKTGFAHLFEHLMFNGSENFNDDYIQALERVGATDLNGTTNNDRTNYFQNVPTASLDVALWMESDRMGHLLGVVDQERLDEQRGVVQNEKRQGENQPYGVTDQLIVEGTYPPGHPYSWTVIGSMEDLEAASLEDVHTWFETYYGAANAVIVLAGDIDPETARERVEHYFGHIPAGPPIARQEAWIAKRSGTHRQSTLDRVPQARIYKVWNIPEWRAEELAYLDLVTDVLGSGKNARLYKRLVYEDQIATDVAAFVRPHEVGSQLVLQATAQQGVELAEVEAAMDEELAEFLSKGPVKNELQRIKTQYRARFIRGIERVGGFGGKSDILASNEVYGGSPDYYKTTLRRVAEATARDLKDAARAWLSDGAYILEVHPYPKFATAEDQADRSRLPAGGGLTRLELPPMERATLSNGLEVIFSQRTDIPVVDVQLVVNAGYAADQHHAPGTASLATAMLDEGTRRRSALKISAELELLGATLGTRSNLDLSVVTLSTLEENLRKALDIFADVIINPAFPEEDFQRVKRQRLAGIRQEQANPVQLALRIFPKLLYGEGHAYGNPYTGSGTTAAVEAMTRQLMVDFHRTWFQPGNATLVVVGATTLAEVIPLLEAKFAGWKDQAPPPAINVGAVDMPLESSIYLIDKPGAIQTVILAGHVAPPTNNPNEIAISAMNYILGGAFTSRVNMNLREDKHWSYGAHTLLLDARGPRTFVAYAPVQTDKTKESMAEINKELRDILGRRPATADELQKAKDNRTLRLPGAYETKAAVRDNIVRSLRFGLPDDYMETFAEKVLALRLADITRVARQVVHPDKFTWIVVGDRSEIESGIRLLGYGEVHIIDTEGNPVE